jgi:hypothetical protein
MLLDFNFLSILNFLVLLCWPATGRWVGTRSDALGIIMLILTIIAVMLDIVFLALRLIHG